MARSPDLLKEDIDIMFATNVAGLINMTQAILPIFLKRENGGRGDIINLNSIAGREAYVGGSIYCATKAAVRSYTDALRRELISSGIRVIEIAPGQVETEFSVVRFGGDKEKADKVYEGVEPLTPEDVAEVIVFAASRRENVVVADVLLYPSHQVCDGLFFVLWFGTIRGQSTSKNVISTKAMLFRKFHALYLLTLCQAGATSIHRRF
jgi:3-hydroxy acid dehydrogenase/malonic semialdehyde reductase